MALIFILFCAFQLYQMQIVSSSKKSQFTVDDFINQLMTSKKFSELTDIIAEKAAKKMKSFQQDNEEHSSSEREFRKTVDLQTVVPEPKTVKRNQNEKSKKVEGSVKFGKINTDAFLKQDLNSGEIFLNYKHMTNELKRSDFKTNQKSGGTHSDFNSEMYRDKHSEKPKYQSAEHKIKPLKHIKTDKVEEIQNDFNKTDKSIGYWSGETKNNDVDNIANEASEEHEILIEKPDDELPQVNVKKGPNSNETLDKYTNSDENNDVDIKSIKKHENIEGNIEAVKSIEISNKELEEQDKSIITPERSSESINEQETRSHVTESSEKSVDPYYKNENVNKENPDDFSVNIKKHSNSIKYKENSNEKSIEMQNQPQPHENFNKKHSKSIKNKEKSNEKLIEMQNQPQPHEKFNKKYSKSIKNKENSNEKLIEMQNQPQPHENFNKKYSRSIKNKENSNEKLIETQNQPKPHKIHLMQNRNTKNSNMPKLQKGSLTFRTQKSRETPKADQRTEYIEDYSDVLNFEVAKERLLKEPYRIFSRNNGKIHTHNDSESDYIEYKDKLVSKGNSKEIKNSNSFIL